MLARSSAEIIDTAMDASIEGEANMDGLDWNGDIGDDDVPEEEPDDDADIIGIDDKVPDVFNFDTDSQEITLPDEVSQYIESLSSETRKLENELRECDELLQYSPGKPHVSSALIPYNDFKDIEEAAAMRGMSVEEFQQQILNELKESEFNEEEVDEEYEEFLQMQREFAELRADLPAQDSDEKAKILAIQGADSSAADVNNHNETTSAISEDATEGEESNNTEESMALVKFVGDEDITDMQDDLAAGPVSIDMAALSSMRDFILEQLRRNEEFYERKRQHLVESIETLHHEEEKEMLRTEGRRKDIEDQIKEQKEILRLKRETNEALLEEETKILQEQTSQELGQHQLEIDRLSAALAEERHQFEQNERQWQDRLADTRAKAALKIQKVFRGVRTRQRHAAELAEMAELRELRVKEKHTLRLMELEYEIKVREEEEAKAKAEAEEKRKRQEEERRKEKERKEKEEADRIAGLIQKEKNRMEEEAQQAELKKKKEEEEEQRKTEEKKRKEEEVKRKEEEKRLKEEEKKRQKEEEKQRKEEEKKKKEEEKRKKKEEKQKAEEEKKKQKEEEKAKSQQEALKSQAPSHTPNEESEPDNTKIETKKIYEKFVEEKVENTKQINHNSSTGSTDLRSSTNNNNNSALESTVSPTSDNATNVDVMSAETVVKAESISSKAQSETLIKEAEHATKEPNQATSNTSILTPRNSLQKLHQQNQQSAEKSEPPSQNQQTAQKSESSLPAASASAVGGVVPSAASSLKTVAATTLQSNTATSTTEATVAASRKASSSAPSPQPQLQPQPPPAPPPEPSPPQPSASELKRLEWIKSCIPWSKVSNEPWKLSQAAGKVHKKPVSAKKLPAVAEAVVLAAAQAETLRQVSSVTLRDLPGCSLSTLGQCWSLRYLTVTHCSLLCLDGLSQCRHLLYINAEDNLLEYVDLKDLGSLQVARLARNNLGSVHGFEGCINLRWLDLSHNSITRIGPGLSPLRRLHTLDLSHNQLVSAQGLELVVTCQSLLLDHNYLQAVQGLDKLCLLTDLSLAGNNLLQVPELKNQVLLQTLNVNENSVKSLEGLASSWLPLLTTLTCVKNLLESCKGLDLLDSLEMLDVGFNQIEDFECLTTYLGDKEHLKRLVVKGNPLVDIYNDDYRSKLATMLPALNSIDSEQVGPGDVKKSGKVDTNTWINTEFLEMCQAQIKLHGQLKAEFDKNIQSLLGNKSVTSESLCGTYFSFCDTSFKMASEHRSAHEYGDMSLSTTTSSHFGDNQATGYINSEEYQATNAGKRTAEVLGQKSKVTGGVAGSQSVLDKKALFDQAATAAHVKQNGSSSARSSQDFSVRYSREDKYSMHQQQLISHKQRSKNSSSSQKAKERQGNHTSTSQHKLTASSVSKGKFKPGMESSESSSDSDSDEDLRGGGNFHSKASVDTDGSRSAGHTKTYNGYKHIPHPPMIPPALSYTNEKDKFEMALNSSSARGKPHNTLQNSDTHQVDTSLVSEKGRFEMTLKNAAFVPETNGRDMFEQALQRSSGSTMYADPREKFNGALQKGITENTSSTTQRGGVAGGGGGVTANVVGFQLAEGNGMPGEDLDLAALGLGLDEEVDLDNLDFDIDKFLEMDTSDLDEFLEKGWRPEESPQIPQSSYPVLGKITPAGDSAPTSSSSYYNNNNHNYNASVPGKPPAGPPQHPTQAWRNSPAAEFRGKQSQSPYTAGVTALPTQPSPSPSSVASAAETPGGGTVKSKKDELVDEWGFKDSRTAEMMMARAKKMKWNAERKKKLSKLDPQQRLHLFRKLEESGKIQPVRTAAPARVLPRKEYFQAREEEAQREHLERRVEEQTRVHRTFEWLHTQVGDHPVSTSRINAGQAPVYSTNEVRSGRQAAYKTNQDNRKWSPGSDHLDSVSQSGANRPRQGRRYSIGDSQYFNRAGEQACSKVRSHTSVSCISLDKPHHCHQYKWVRHRAPTRVSGFLSETRQWREAGAGEVENAGASSSREHDHRDVCNFSVTSGQCVIVTMNSPR